MGMHALVIDAEEAKFDAAVEAANAWVETARPIIKAYLALDMIHGDLRAAEFKRRGNRRFGTAASYQELVCRDAGSEVSGAVEHLAKDIDGIRSDTLGDEKLNASDNADDAEWDRVEAFNEELERQCITVDAAIKLVDAAR
jgi:hypothetical protein